MAVKRRGKVIPLKKLEKGDFQISLKIIIGFLQVEMEVNVIPNRRNCVSRGPCGKAQSLPGKWKQSNIADLKRCP